MWTLFSLDACCSGAVGSHWGCRGWRASAELQVLAGKCRVQVYSLRSSWVEGAHVSASCLVFFFRAALVRASKSSKLSLVLCSTKGWLGGSATLSYIRGIVMGICVVTLPLQTKILMEVRRVQTQMPGNGVAHWHCAGDRPCNIQK